MAVRVIIIASLVIISSLITIWGLVTVIKYVRKHKSTDTNPIFGIFLSIMIAWAITAFFGSAFVQYLDLNNRRQTGLDYEAAGNYIEAYDTYLEIYNERGNWSDIMECLARVEAPARYAEATELYKNQNYLEALEIFLSLGDYGNSTAMADKCMRAYSESQ